MDDAIKSVLKLLEEGRINASEAERLIEEINKNKKNGFSKKMEHLGHSIDQMAKELNERFDGLNKEYSPKVKKTIKDIGDKTSELIQDLTEELNKLF